MKKALPIILATSILLSFISFSACTDQTTSVSWNEKTTNNYQNKYVDDATPTAYYNDGSVFTPVLRFVVTADTHVMSDYMAQTSRRFSNLFSDIYAYARTQEYDKLDAVVVVGDYVDYGQQEQYAFFAETWQKNILPETAFLCLQAGHELISGSRDDHKLYTGNDMGSHVVINGYHFITISNSRYLYDEYGNIVEYEDGGKMIVSDPDPDCDVTWIDNALTEAVADTGTQKPIFTFHHHPVSDTILASSFEGTPIFAPILEKHSNIVDFTAHTHVPNMHPRAIMQNAYTSVSPGAIFYAGNVSDLGKFDSEGNIDYTKKNQGLTKTEACSAVSGATVVEVDATGRIRLLPYNVLMRAFQQDISSGNHNKQLIRYIENAGDKSTWLYTEDRKDKSAPPVFNDDIYLEYSFEDTYIDLTTDISCKRLILTFDNANDEDGIELYKVRLIDKSTNTPINFYKSSNENVKQDYCYVHSKYYLSPYPDRIRVQTTGIDPFALIVGNDYTLEITPVDVYHIEGKPYCVDFVY